MPTDTEHTVFLKDYAPSPYRIEKVELEVNIAPDVAKVHAWLTIVPREGTAAGTPLVLDGDELTLESVALDGAPLVLTRLRGDADDADDCRAAQPRLRARDGSHRAS